jgi:hypothetical protein
MPNPKSQEDEQGEYCRALEAHLCRKNDGHLIRIVGPAFEQVCGWSTRGIPLKLAMRGIDRYFERYYAKGPRRRPVRVEFCEPDVLDVFDEWRRSVGVSSGADDSSGADLSGPRAAAATGGLPAHLERVIARLTTRRAGEDRSLDAAIDAIVRELDASRAKAKTVRGDAREILLDRLRELDASLIEAVRAQCGAGTLETLAAECRRGAAALPYQNASEAYRQSRRACVDRLLRDRARLPTIATSSHDGHNDDEPRRTQRPRWFSLCFLVLSP